MTAPARSEGDSRPTRSVRETGPSDHCERTVRQIAEDLQHEDALEGRVREMSADEFVEVIRLARFAVEMQKAVRLVLAMGRPTHQWGECVYDERKELERIAREGGW